MSDVTLFGKKSTALAALNNVPDFTDTIAGGSGEGGGSTNRRISIKGSVFREILNGKEYRVNEDRAINVVVVRAAPVSRMYFEGTYSEGATLKPTCWSSDSRSPDPSVPQDQKQGDRCLDCNQNIKGSGTGNGRACRFQQRMAVMLEGALGNKEVYQITLPATSIFGEGTKDKMPLQAYGKYLKAHNTNIITIVTEMRFDTSSPTPKLVFKAVRPLDDEEQQAVLDMLEDEATIRAVTLNVSQIDKVIPAPEEKPVLFAPKAEPKPEPVAVQEPEVKAEAEAEPEPKKVVKKSAAPVANADVDLASIVDNWDD
jgi:hypothetical protein